MADNLKLWRITKIFMVVVRRTTNILSLISSPDVLPVDTHVQDFDFMIMITTVAINVGFVPLRTLLLKGQNRKHSP